MDTSSQKERGAWSRRLGLGLIAVGGLLILFLVFDAGFVLGTRHALQMQDPRGGRGTPFGFGEWRVAMPHGFAPEGHGAVGTITAISLPTLTIATRDGDNQTVLLTSRTKIQGATSSLSDQQLQVGQQVIAIGEPGTTTATQLTALLIRLLPPPPVQ